MLISVVRKMFCIKKIPKLAQIILLITFFGHNNTKAELLQTGNLENDLPMLHALLLRFAV